MSPDSVRGTKLSILVVLLLVPLLARPSRADDERPLPEPLASAHPTQEKADPSRWRLLGNFRGTARSDFLEEIGNLLVEMENDGQLYQDLGAVSVGLGGSIDLGDSDLGANWDNSFYRRVEPLHAELEPGQTVGAGDLSRYVDIQSIVSRGQLSYGLSDSVLEDEFGLRSVAEGGASLTLVRARKPLVYGDRPLADILADRRKDDFQDLVHADPRDRDRSLVVLAAEGLAGLARGLAHAFRRTIDTERGLIFYQNAADPMTLMIDVGIPVPAALFHPDDDRLAPGDRIRHVSFFGFSPLEAKFSRSGVESRYEGFVRVLRETIVIKEEDGRARVQVRDAWARGHELVPLKVRPEIRLLKILELGHTFFEKRWDRARSTVVENSWRFDLRDPVAAASFEQLLEQGDQVQLVRQNERPIPPGAERLLTEDRSGGRRSSRLRVDLFSPFRFRDKKSTFSELVEDESGVQREITVARSRELKKRFGRDRNWKRHFLVRSTGDLQVSDDFEGPVPLTEHASVSLLTGISDEHADAVQIRRMAGMLGTLFGHHPVLDELAAAAERDATRFFANLRLRFDVEHLDALLAVQERTLWVELADILLGPDYRHVWGSETARDHFRDRRTRRELEEQMGAAIDALPNPTLHDSISLGKRLRLAERTVKKVQLVRDLIRDGDCLSCLSNAFSRWQDIYLVQMLLYRLTELEPPGGRIVEPAAWQYEVYTDRMLRPSVVTSLSMQETPAEGAEASDADSELTESTQRVLEEVSRADRDWLGAKTFVQPSEPRLRAGSLYLRQDGKDSGGSCAKLRLFSDLRYAPTLSLRADLRRSSGGTGADEPLGWAFYPLGEPTSVISTPFMTARYFYDIPLRLPPDLEPGANYTLLLRMLDLASYPVSEEQQLRFRWPADASELDVECAGSGSP